MKRHFSHKGITFAALGLLVMANLVVSARSADAQDRITDAAGRPISVEKPFMRIISLYGAHTENIYSLGGQKQLIGVSPNDDWPPAVQDKAVFSYRDGLEKFISAGPDLVLIRPMIDRGYERLVTRLEAHGITVASMQPTTPAGMYDYWRDLGRLTGKNRAAEQMIRRFKAVSAHIRARTAAVPNPKKVYFEAIHKRMRTFAPGAMAIYVLKSAGGINVAEDAVARRNTNIADYGKERILSAANRIDVYLAQFGPMNKPSLEMIRNEPGFGLIRAVQNHQIYLIDEKLVSRPTLRLLTGMCRIVQILYPRIYKENVQNMGCFKANPQQG